MSALGVGVIDTSSLWAAGSLIYHGSEPDAAPDLAVDFLHPSRQLYSTKHSYFLSLLHNLVLYDELRTDIDVLSSEVWWYCEPVRRLLESLSSVVKVDSIPQTLTDEQIMEAIAPAFLSKTKAELGGRQPSPGSGQIAIAASSFEGFSSSLQEEQFNGKVMLLSPKVREGLAELAQGDLGPKLNKIKDKQAKFSALVRNLSILARTVRYAAHSKSVQTAEKRPSAFCASPRRIELLQDYVDGAYMKLLRAGVEDVVDLFSQLGLPRTGYDFSAFSATIKPLSLTDLSHSLAGLQPTEALDRVLEVRDTSEAQQLRRIWSERLWSGGMHALEGYGQVMENVRAGRDVIQIIAREWGSEQVPREYTAQEPEPGAPVRKGPSGDADTKVSEGIRELGRWIQSKLRGT